MRNLLLFAAVVLLGCGIALAQSPPPAGAGNNPRPTTGGDIHSSSPATSPDQNSQITGDTGSTTGQNYPAGYAGAPGHSTTGSATAQGVTGETGSASATSGRRSAYNGAAQSRGPARRHMRRRKRSSHPGTRGNTPPQ